VVGVLHRVIVSERLSLAGREVRRTANEIGAAEALSAR
jgi:hypothetical protein